MERKATGDICIDSPAEAYIGKIDCKHAPTNIAEIANSKINSIQGGCALEGAILHESTEAFEVFLQNGGNIRRCTGYPLRIFGAVASICRDNPKLAHRFFELIGTTGAFDDGPQTLLLKSTMLRCVEGVKIALAHGAKTNTPNREKSTDGWVDPAVSYLPLETATIYGTRGYPYPMIEIVTLLVAAGASPLAVDAQGDTLLKRAEKNLGGAPYWPQLRAALLGEVQPTKDGVDR